VTPLPIWQNCMHFLNKKPSHHFYEAGQKKNFSLNFSVFTLDSAETNERIYFFLLFLNFMIFQSALNFYL
jgi:hypothetical protein